MDDRMPQDHKPNKPRRKKKTKLQIFKETYLPFAIAAGALFLILIFIIGSITRAVQRSNARDRAETAASIAAAEELERLTAEAEALSDQAIRQAATFDYEGAISTLESFSGDINDFAQLYRLYLQYQQEQASLVAWEDPSQVVNLSLQQLIVDPDKAFADKENGNSFLKNFITVDEFTEILRQLYENGYILVDMEQLASGGNAQTLYLPAGKKPLMLTQTQVNYYTYMTDGDGDKEPDKDGSGFASKLLIDPNGNLTCQYITDEGEIVTGAYDLVPILEAFIATHPDFSYKGARATLAVTGYDGIFGYRITAKAKERLGEEAYQSEVAQAIQVTQALRNAGYTIACGTYENSNYGSFSAARIQKDLDNWNAEIAPVLGVVDTLVYARNSDIAAASAAYEGEKFQVLQNFGFTNYLGFCSKGEPWFSAGGNYVRQGRILVTGNNLTAHADWFSQMFDAATVRDSIRDDYA